MPKLRNHELCRLSLAVAALYVLTLGTLGSFSSAQTEAETEAAGGPKGSKQFAKAIKDARKIMFAAPWVVDSPRPANEKAGAERQLQHLISLALDEGFRLHDPLRPVFRTLDQHNQFGLTNPDSRYLSATISTPGTYVIRGQRGTSADLEIQVGAGIPGFGAINIAPISQMSLEDLVVDEDGSFEIVISDIPTGDNWLANSDGATLATRVLIRESFTDWENQKRGTWYIERVDSRGTPSPLPDRDLVRAQYALASEYLVASAQTWVGFVAAQLPVIPPDTMTPPVQTPDGLPGQASSIGFFALESHEAVIITMAESPAKYQSIQVGDLWFNSLDFCHRQTSLTVSQARHSGDGRIRLVISRQDPGVENWLDLAGASTAVAFIRWQGLPDGYEFAPSEFPFAVIVNVDEVRDFLPPDEPHFGPGDRVEQLAARQKSCTTTPRGF